jgi:predicted membrane GTPase involved in stress response
MCRTQALVHPCVVHTQLTTFFRPRADITEAKSGDIVALFGVDCASGDTFTDGKYNVAMTSIRVPDAVLSLAVAPKSKVPPPPLRSTHIRRYLIDDHQLHHTVSDTNR